ncbi:MAG: TrmH family RNA methyltransferase [Bacteroidales bacterium]
MLNTVTLNTDVVLTQYLSQFLTERRLRLIDGVLESRSRYITCLLEDIYQSQNASAIVRSCECCGLQEIHVAEETNPLHYNPLVLRGADRWIDVIRHPRDERPAIDTSGERPGHERPAIDGRGERPGHERPVLDRRGERPALESALSALRKGGYRIVAATPHANDSDVEGFDLEGGPFALVMGNEKRGVSQAVMAVADAFVRIPMFGFTESFNVSVSAGILLSQLAVRLRASDISWQLSDSEKRRLRLEWVKLSLRNPEALIARFYERPKE